MPLVSAPLREAFARFANQIPFWGAAVLCLDHPGVQAVLPRLTRRTVTYGTTPQADFVASEVRADGFGMRFEASRGGERLGGGGCRGRGRHGSKNPPSEERYSWIFTRSGGWSGHGKRRE